MDHGYIRSLGLDPKSLSSNRRPDAVALYKDKSVARVEVASKTDDPGKLWDRNQAINKQLAAKGFKPLPTKVIPYATQPTAQDMRNFVNNPQLQRPRGSTTPTVPPAPTNPNAPKKP